LIKNQYLLGNQFYLSYLCIINHTIMKIIFTSLLLMLFATTQAMPVLKDSLDNGKKGQVSTPVTPNVSTATMSMQQLQEENAMLKAKLFQLENRLEDEKGMLQYKLTMTYVLSRIAELDRINKMEELKSQINFGKSMSGTLMLLKNEVVR
jgi:hypothetical protein